MINLKDVTEIKVNKKPSLTYRLDFDNKKIVGKIDGHESVVQAVRKILNTERYTKLIYSGNYGVELIRLIGQDFGYIKADIGRTLAECLKTDDRVVRVKDIEVKKTELNDIAINFKIVTIYGEENAEVIL